MRDFRQARIDFNIAYEISEMFFDRYFQLKCAEWIGQTLSMMKMHLKAIEYFSTMLYLSWSIHNLKYEIKAYDYLGLQNFYIGEIETAKKFHTKMVEG